MDDSSVVNVLAIDTSTVACSVALIYQGQHYFRYQEVPQKHAVVLLGMIDEVMKEAGIEGASLDCLAYGEGPGAFTGIRVAAGAIQGLALGWDKPVVAVSSLTAMAFQMLAEQAFEDKDKVITWASMLDARMNEVYLQTGNWDVEARTLSCTDIQLMSPEDAITAIKQVMDVDGYLLGMGDVLGVYPQLAALPFTEWADTLPHALAIAKLAQLEHSKAKSLTEEIPLPVYLRNNVAETIEQRKQKKAM